MEVYDALRSNYNKLGVLYKAKFLKFLLGISLTSKRQMLLLSVLSAKGIFHMKVLITCFRKEKWG